MQDQMRALVPVPPRTPTNLLMIVVSGLKFGFVCYLFGKSVPAFVMKLRTKGQKKGEKNEFHHLHEPGDHLGLDYLCCYGQPKQNVSHFVMVEPV